MEGQSLAVHDPGNWLWPHLAPWPEAFVRAARAKRVGQSLDSNQASRLPAKAPVYQPEKPSPDHSPLIWVDWRVQDGLPEDWLILRPSCLAAGMGCNRGASADEMEDLLTTTLAQEGLSLRSLACLATVEAKQDEAGLLELAQRLGPIDSFFRGRGFGRGGGAQPLPRPGPLCEHEERMRSSSTAGGEQPPAIDSQNQERQRHPGGGPWQTLCDRPGAGRPPQASPFKLRRPWPSVK